MSDAPELCEYCHRRHLLTLTCRDAAQQAEQRAEKRRLDKEEYDRLERELVVREAESEANHTLSEQERAFFVALLKKIKET